MFGADMFFSCVDRVPEKVEAILRDRLVRELRKEKNSSDPGPAYTSCWPYYDTLRSGFY